MGVRVFFLSSYETLDLTHAAAEPRQNHAVKTNVLQFRGLIGGLDQWLWWSLPVSSQQKDEISLSEGSTVDLRKPGEEEDEYSEMAEEALDPDNCFPDGQHARKHTTAHPAHTGRLNRPSGTKQHTLEGVRSRNNR